ncbi:MAG TPA: VWA domain-containing protein [Gemmatimonadales bacterium]|nr:VWA domain-containing protein [Gemmatimonadales bacterium]
MIGFSAPWALLGLAAAAFPVLLHLFARREPPTVAFPATRYLAETARAHHRRLTLQHWLLLLVRTLLIIALALAAAGPTLPSGGASTHAPAALAIVLDNSLSSAATVGGTPVLDQLRAPGLAILRAARPDDVLWLITADGLPRRGTASELGAVVNGLVPVAERLDLGAAVSAAREAMAASPLPQSVVVLSDLQATALSAAAGAGAVLVLHPDQAVVSNLGISALATGRQPWGGDGGRIDATIRGTPGKSAALSVVTGNRPPRRQLATSGSLAGASSGPLTPGWWPVRAEIEPDELRPDDSRETAVRVAEPARASWRNEDRFIATACEVLLANGRLARGADLTIGSLGPGASVVTPPADAAVIGALNRALASRGVAWRYGDLAAGSGVVDSGSVLGRQEVTRRYALLPVQGRQEARSRGTGVLVTVGGQPWAVRDGNTVLLGSRLEPDWLALPLAAEFVPFVDFLANRAVRGELVQLDVPPGEAVFLPDAATAVIRDGRTRTVEGGAAFRSAELGLHFILSGRDTIGVVAVNPDPRESELARAGDDEVRRLWPGARFAPLTRAVTAAFASGGRADLRGMLLLLAALLALSDAVLAGTGARRAARRPA